MYIRRFLNDPLVSAEAALEIVRIVLRTRSGAEKLRAQEPLTVEQDGDFWVVLGRPPSDRAPAQVSSDEWVGSIRVVLARLDGQIVEFEHRLVTDWLSGPQTDRSSGPNDPA